MESKTALNNVMSIIQNDELAEKYDVGAVQLLKGKIEFRNVSFNYPLRPVPVLKNLSFTA
jgi:ABC-type multidrug transport system fused ATPase/permease subunit